MTDWQRAVFRVTATPRSPPDLEPRGGYVARDLLGTAFVCARDGDTSYLLTSGHVLATACKGTIKVGDKGDVDLILCHPWPFDIALLKVKGLPDGPVLPLARDPAAAWRRQLPAVTYGWWGGRRGLHSQGPRDYRSRLDRSGGEG